MCGIVGLFNPLKITDNLKEVDLFKSMINSLINRGPDEKGILFSKIGWLGHTRLSILDIESGHQPMCSLDKDIALVFNGEIFNFIEIRTELIGKGYHFQTNSDTEVLIHLYRDLGTKMFIRLNGQFSVAIIDFKKNILLLSRDRFGILPLFYTFLDKSILFSSSIKTILLNPLVKRDFNLDAYFQMTNIWTTFGNKTFIKNVFSIEPGEFIVVSKAGIKKEKYWELDFPAKPKKYTIDEWKEKVREGMSNSINIRLRADVPVMTYLSGGLDSSIILELAKRNHEDRKSVV